MLAVPPFLTLAICGLMDLYRWVAHGYSFAHVFGGIATLFGVAFQGLVFMVPLYVVMCFFAMPAVLWLRACRWLTPIPVCLFAVGIGAVVGLDVIQIPGWQELTWRDWRQGAWLGGVVGLAAGVLFCFCAGIPFLRRQRQALSKITARPTLKVGPASGVLVLSMLVLSLPLSIPYVVMPVVDARYRQQHPHQVFPVTFHNALADRRLRVDRRVDISVWSAHADVNSSAEQYVHGVLRLDAPQVGNHFVIPAGATVQGALVTGGDFLVDRYVRRYNQLDLTVDVSKLPERAHGGAVAEPEHEPEHEAVTHIKVGHRSALARLRFVYPGED